ncbi:MAG: cation:proton antiporter, partial [Muribaculaceae bacterium]|nr:cation:proton antiporter [Muribaculaceae bacterium]
SFLGSLSETLLDEVRREVMVVKMLMPFNTIRRIVVAVPPKAEYEAGFTKWVDHLTKMASAMGCRIYFHSNERTLEYIRRITYSRPIKDKVTLQLMESWDDLLMLSAAVNYDHLLVVVTARRGSISYDKSFDNLPGQLTRYFSNTSLLLLYPDQHGEPTALQAFADPMQGHLNPVSWSTTIRHNYDVVRRWLRSKF